MPKKFGVNNKSQEAREKKDTAKKENRQKELQQKEDAKWVETDKHLLEKEKRKKEKEEKKNTESQRKAEARELLAKEEEELKQKHAKNQPPPKITRAEIDRTKQIEEVAAKRREDKEKKNKEIETEPPIEENVNRIIAQEKEELGDGYVEARSLDDAVDKMALSPEQRDRRLEKRMKAAYNAYEGKTISLLREENPTLKLSQLKEMCWKRWQKSEDNPMNQ